MNCSIPTQCGCQAVSVRPAETFRYPPVVPQVSAERLVATLGDAVAIPQVRHLPRRKGKYATSLCWGTGTRVRHAPVLCPRAPHQRTREPLVSRCDYLAARSSDAGRDEGEH
jgi:hypothetical protein